MTIKLNTGADTIVVDGMLGARESSGDVIIHTTSRGLARLEGLVTLPIAVVSQNLTTLWVRVFGAKLM